MHPGSFHLREEDNNVVIPMSKVIYLLHNTSVNQDNNIREVMELFSLGLN